MASAGQITDDNTTPGETIARAILALLVEEREERLKAAGMKDAQKVEILLANAGLGNDDIAAITGKKPDAVRMAISRAKAK